MELLLYLDKIKLAIHKRLAKKTGGLTYEVWKAKGYDVAPEVSFVLQSHNKSLQICHIVKKLRTWNGRKEIIVIDDGSGVDHTHRLAKFITGANEFLIKANDLFEISTYDKAIRFANGQYIVLMQDDDDFDSSLRWIDEGVALMRKHADMVILGGKNGHDIIMDHEFEYGSFAEGLFCYVAGVNRAPMWLNKELFVRHLKNIDQDFAPLMFDDDELCLRAWENGLKVGWYDAAFYSLSPGGTRLGKNTLMQRQVAHNRELIYNMYKGKMGNIRERVARANEALTEQSK